jgi:hypothetical protein
MLNMEKMRSDMELSRKAMEWETRKFVVSLMVATAALAGGGATLGNYIGSRPQPGPAPIVIHIERTP